jgi:hypothetical protein
MSLSTFSLHLGYLEDISCMVHHSCPNVSLYIWVTWKIFPLCWITLAPISLSTFSWHLGHLEDISCLVYHSCPKVSLYIFLTFRSLEIYFLCGASLLPQYLSLHFPYIYVTCKIFPVLCITLAPMFLYTFSLHLCRLKDISCMVHHSCRNNSLYIFLTFRSLGIYFLYGASLLPQCFSVHFPYI